MNRACSTPDCRRSCRPDWAMCNRCFDALFTRFVPQRIVVARLSKQDGGKQ
jgi:hypothetical protein